MDTKKKNILWIIVVAIFAYVVGVLLGFPFAQLGLSTGDSGLIGRANKHQEQLTSPADVQLVEKFETDTAYRNKLISGYATLYVQAKATTASIVTLKQKIGVVKGLENYIDPMNEVMGIGEQLTALLEKDLKGLGNVSNKKKVANLSLDLSQALNLFQLMNYRLNDLNAFTLKMNDFVKQRQLNSEILQSYSEYIIQASSLAFMCGDKASASDKLGELLRNQSLAHAAVDAASAANLKLFYLIPQIAKINPGMLHGVCCVPCLLIGKNPSPTQLKSAEQGKVLNEAFKGIDRIPNVISLSEQLSGIGHPSIQFI
ncbi:MAG: hypothetical protein LKM37_04930 [Bacteroidales bacterium]|jgi:hypothetical protein|nr:hypothetical protein [Bacteroidales bacterium]MCI1733853.1 hypothetical protein [Bacteroidales bacterium]